MEGPFQLSRSVVDAVVSDPRPAVFLLLGDDLSRLRAEYLVAGHQRDNPFWGWIRPADP